MLKEVKNSSNILAAGYDAETRVLTVRFKNAGREGYRDYEYQNIPEKLAGEFESTFDVKDSTGSFFYKNIRGKFKYEAI